MIPCRCGHYTTGETPFKYIDGFYLGHFIYKEFKRLARNHQPASLPSTSSF
jgi:hypothetical protein